MIVLIIVRWMSARVILESISEQVTLIRETYSSSGLLLERLHSSWAEGQDALGETEGRLRQEYGSEPERKQWRQINRGEGDLRCIWYMPEKGWNEGENIHSRWRGRSWGRDRRQEPWAGFYRFGGFLLVEMAAPGGGRTGCFSTDTLKVGSFGKQWGALKVFSKRLIW